MWTNDQQSVIDARDTNILVSAAAGSGKTAVLVERIIRMITDEKAPVDIDSLLIVTFTEAAAAEMKERIADAITKLSKERPDDRHLAKERLLVHNAQISTIHSFCTNIIRNYFHLIELDPGFRVAEDAEIKMISQDVMDEMLEQHYAAGDPDFLRFINSLGNDKSDLEAEELIKRLAGLALSHVEPEKWLEEIKSAYNTEGGISGTPWFKELLTCVKYRLSDLDKIAGEALSVCTGPDGPVKYTDAVLSDIDIIKCALKGNTYTEIYNALREDFAKLKSGKDNGSDENRKYVKDLRDTVKEKLKGIREKYFAEPEETVRADIAACAENINTLVSLTSEYMLKFSETKRIKNVIDFSDMEHLALKILEFPEPCEELADKFYEVMTDEYQDSNEVQETLLNRVSKVARGGKNRFSVGDVKQSIYGFRLADPSIFTEKYDTYREDPQNGRCIELHKNFRSRREVLEFTNEIMRRIMQKEIGGVLYDDDAALCYGADYEKAEEEKQPELNPVKNTEIIIISKEGKWEDVAAPEGNAAAEDDAASGSGTFSAENGKVPGNGAEEQESTELELEKDELEGAVIAKRILELMDPKAHNAVYDKRAGGYRPIRYSDIAILMRALTGHAKAITDALTKAGIPSFTDAGTGYFDAPEIVALTEYLRILDNPKQDIPFATVLLSPLGGLTGEELAYIRTEGGKDIPLYEAARKVTGLESLNRFFAIYDSLREECRFTGIDVLLSDIYEKTGFYNYVGAASGDSARANLVFLREKAEAFEKTSYHGLFNFIRYIDRLRKYDVDYGDGAVSGADAVNIMTIHKSKGLEFPVVILARCGGQRNKMDESKAVIMHSKLGIGMKAFDPVNRVRSNTVLRSAVINRIHTDSVGEELRVLYVALTRAREKLIITGVVNDAAKAAEKWRQTAEQCRVASSYEAVFSAVTTFDLIMPPVYDAGLRDLVYGATAELLVSGEMEKKRDILERAGELQTAPAGEKDAQIAMFADFVYPYADEINRKIKYSVSELKTAAMKKAADIPEVCFEHGDTYGIPASEPGDAYGMSASERGTAVHKIMKLLPYNGQEIGAILDELEKNGKISASEKTAGDTGIYGKFLSSPLGKRMAAASARGELFRERPFVFGVRLDDDGMPVFGKEKNGADVLVQGVIDAYFYEDGDIILVDYKTDRVGEDGADVLRLRYRTQLDLYAEALERLVRKKVREKLIYSFALSETISV